MHKIEIFFPHRTDIYINSGTVTNVTQTYTISDLVAFENVVRMGNSMFSMAAKRCIEMCQLQMNVQNVQSIIRYAFDTSIQKHDLMGVDLSNYTQNKPYAVPFFQYLNRSVGFVATIFYLHFYDL